LRIYGVFWGLEGVAGQGNKYNKAERNADNLCCLNGKEGIDKVLRAMFNQNNHKNIIEHYITPKAYKLRR